MENGMQLVEVDQQGEALPVAQQPARMTGGTPVDLLRYAMENGADLDRLERLMAMVVEHEKREATKAFVSAMAVAKLTAPDLKKTQGTRYETKQGGTTAYDFANIGDINPPIIKWLAENGFDHNWEPDQNGSVLGITCVITHKHGHSKRFRLEAGADTSGGKNSIQALGSAQTYLERYTLLGVTGLAVSGMDDDGHGSASPSAPEVKHPKEKIVGPRFAQALAAVKAGRYNSAEMRDYYELTPDQETALKDVEKEIAQ